jgi:CPSF A subunit-like protein
MPFPLSSRKPLLFSPAHHYPFAPATVSYPLEITLSFLAHTRTVHPQVFGVEISGESRQLDLVAETQTRGAVYTIKPFNGRVVAGINARVVVYEWAVSGDDRCVGLQC